MAEINLSDGNIQNLKAVRNMISVEDGKEIDVDEALSRILRFYRIFVPYD